MPLKNRHSKAKRHHLRFKRSLRSKLRARRDAGKTATGFIQCALALTQGIMDAVQYVQKTSGYQR